MRYGNKYRITAKFRHSTGSCWVYFCQAEFSSNTQMISLPPVWWQKDWERLSTLERVNSQWPDRKFQLFTSHSVHYNDVLPTWLPFSDWRAAVNRPSAKAGKRGLTANRRAKRRWTKWMLPDGSETHLNSERNDKKVWGKWNETGLESEHFNLVLLR